MQNIYRNWTEYNKIQNQVIRGGDAAEALKVAEQSAEEWKMADYPTGEDWKYVKYDQLPTTNFKWPQEDSPSQQLADEDFYVIDVKNFKTPQSPKLVELPEGLKILSEIESSNPPLSSDQQDSNPFSQIARSFYGLGLTLEVSSKFKAERPIKLLFDYDSFSSKDLFLQQNVRLKLESHAQAQVFVDVKGETFSGLSNLCYQVDVGENARLDVYSKEMGGPQSYFVMNLSADVGAKGHFRCFDFTLPSHWSRHNYSANLNAIEAKVELYGAYLNNGENFVDHHTTIRHKVGATESKEDYRGILSDQSRAVFNGKVFIAEKASKSNSEQINRNLMLSNKAEIDTKPELQIDNDDVKAAHGATVGRIDEEQRFYLQSRGYSNEQAGRILSKAFIFDLIENEGPIVDNFYHSHIEETLERLEESR